MTSVSTPPPSPMLPPAPSQTISSHQLSELAAAIAQHGSPSLEHLWALHRDLLLGEGQVWARENGGTREVALAVPTLEGLRVVAVDGQVLSGFPAGPEWVPTTWEQQPQVCAKKSARAGQGMMSYTGIGLLFEASRPLEENEQAELVEAMWGFSCHPYLGRKIVGDLAVHGRRAATTMPHLLAYMELMKEQFGAFGVSVRRCWPMPSRGRPEVPQAEQSVPMPRHIPKLG